MINFEDSLPPPVFSHLSQDWLRSNRRCGGDLEVDLKDLLNILSISVHWLLLVFLRGPFSILPIRFYSVRKRLGGGGLRVRLVLE
jgi:hypothetical protein